MKEYKQVNKEGYVIETFVLRESEDIPSDYKPSWGPDSSFYTPRWDFSKKQWVESKDSWSVLKEQKESKKAILSRICQQKILDGFDFSCKGKLYRFSYDYESQTNFQETYHLFQNSVIESVKWSAKLDGESVRIDLDKKDFEAVFFASVRHKQAHISKFKDQIEPLIEAQSTTEGLEAISWNGLVTNPENPGVVFKTDDTLDKQVTTLDLQTQKLNDKTELSDMAIMEIAMMVSMMMGGPM